MPNFQVALREQPVLIHWYDVVAETAEEAIRQVEDYDTATNPKVSHLETEYYADWETGAVIEVIDMDDRMVWKLNDEDV